MPSKKLIGKVLMESGLFYRYQLNWTNGSKIFLKINIGKDPILKNHLDREIAALDHLKKLAVPKRIPIPRKSVTKLIKKENFAYMAMEWVPLRDCWARKFSTDEAVGLWAFILEQLCAFRRKSILYTDIKPTHFLISDDFRVGKIIDFGGCLMVESKGEYPIDMLQTTPEFSGPETYFSWKHTERIIVYQMGMLFGNLLVGPLKNADLNAKSLGKLKKKLIKGHFRHAWEVLEKSISPRPVNRQRDLEVLFSQFQEVALSSAAQKIWINLRTPYQKELSKLGFKEPRDSSVRKRFAKAA